MVLLLAGAAVLSCIGAAPPPSDERIDIGSHRLRIHREGEGRPAVVIDAGLADPLERFRPLAERLAGATQVVTYDRAGYGESEPGPTPRDAGREADELKALLDSASVPGPYVLVGHSLGAMNVQVFAARYPDQVAGLVLMDPPPLSFILGKEYGDLRAMADRMTESWRAQADSAARSDDPRDRAQSAFLRMIASEHEAMFGESAKLLAAVTTFGDEPVVVIASGRPNPAFGAVAEEFQHFWIGQSRLVAGRFANGRFVLVEGASHHLYEDAPDLVVKSIVSVVEAARGK
jgi:pimeloyl-ACP methyl ester carboxylesterase